MIKNIVLAACGMKAFAYLGAIEELKMRKILNNVERVAGTSSGSIAALILSLGYTLEESKRKIFYEIDFNKFIAEKNQYSIYKMKRLYYKWGIYTGKYILDTFYNLIEERTGKPNTTFKELHNLKQNELLTYGKTKIRDLYVNAVNVRTGKEQIFSYEHTPDVEIALAVRASIAIPLFFCPVEIPFTVDDSIVEEIFFDGAAHCSLMLNIFDKAKYLHEKPIFLKPEDEIKNTETICFKLALEPERSDKPSNLPDYIETIIQKFVGQKPIKKEDLFRVVNLPPLDVKASDFDLSLEKKKEIANIAKITTGLFLDDALAIRETQNLFDTSSLNDFINKYPSINFDTSKPRQKQRTPILFSKSAAKIHRLQLTKEDAHDSSSTNSDDTFYLSLENESDKDLNGNKNLRI